MVKNISISRYYIYQAVLLQLIQFIIRTDFVYSQLNVKIVLY